MTRGATSWEELVREVHAERRSEGRPKLTYRVEMRWIGSDGVLLVERTKTHDISSAGCCIRTDAPLHKDDVISVRLLGPREQETESDPHLFEVMWSADSPDGRIVGARKLDDKKCWKVSFPPPKVDVKPGDK